MFVERVSTTHLQFGAQTALPLSLRYNAHPEYDENIDIPTEIRYSNYRQTDGVTLPFKIQKFINNALVLELDIESATVTFESPTPLLAQQP